MKKRVRIYKAKTGMQMPTAEAMNQPNISDTDIINASIGLIANEGLTVNEILTLFAQKGLDPRRVQPLVAGLAENIEKRKLAREAQQKGDDTTLARIDQQEAIDKAAADAEDRRKRQEMYYSDYSRDDDSEDLVFQQNILGLKYGSEMPSKREFIKKFIKKAEEGMQMSERADSTDTGQRKAGLQQFVDSVQSSADTAKIKEEGEALLDLVRNKYKFDRGGLTRGQERASEQAALLASALGANPYLPPLEKLEVPKTRMFSHAPKAWTAYFGQRPTMTPDQLQPQSVYTNTVSSPARKKNELSLEEVDKMINADDKKEAANAETQANTAAANTSSTSGGGSGSSGGGRSDGGNRTTVRTEEETPATGTYLESSYRPYMNTAAFANATAEEVRKKNAPITYNTYVNQEGKIDGSKDFLDPNKSYTYDPLSKKWYRGTSTKAITDKKAIENLNRWKSKGILEETVDVETRNMSSKEAQDLMYKLQTTPQAAMADDELVQFLTMMGINPSSLVNLPQFALKQMAKGFLESGAKGLPGQRQLGPGASSKQLGSGNLGLPGGPNANSAGSNMFNTADIIEGIMNSSLGIHADPFFNTQGKYIVKDAYGKIIEEKNKKQLGGFSDADSGLSRFVYGGDEDGKLINSPYFEDGGLVKAQAGYWKKKEDNSGEYEWVQGVHPTDAAELNRTNQYKTNLSYTQQQTGQPQVGQTMDEWRLSQGQSMGIMGSRPDDPVWDGTKWVRPNTGGYQLPYNNPYIGNQYADYGYNPYGIPQYQLKQRGLPVDVASGRRYYGEFDNPELAKLTAKGIRRSGAPRRMEAEFYVDDWDPNNTMGNTQQPASTDDQPNNMSFADRLMNSKVRPVSILGAKLQRFDNSNDEQLQNWLRQGYVKTPSPKEPVYSEPASPASGASTIQNILTQGQTGSYADMPSKNSTAPGITPFVPFSIPAMPPFEIGGYLPKAQMYNSQTGVDPIVQDERFMANYPYQDEWSDIDDTDWTSAVPIPEDLEEEKPLNWSQKAEALANAESIKNETGVDLNEGPKVDYGRKKIKVKYKNKEKMSGADRRLRLDMFNAAGNTVLNMFNRPEQPRPWERYGSVSAIDEGNYTTNRGDFRPPSTGFKDVVRSGGYMEDGGNFDPYETWMSEDDIRRFYEEGGELEFI
jgi:hypothetical protein